MSFDKNGFYKSVGNLIKRQRNSANKTQDDIATVLNLNRASYANLESGRQRIPVDIIWKLSVFYNTPIKNLVPEPDIDKKSGTTSLIDDSHQTHDYIPNERKKEFSESNL